MEEVPKTMIIDEIKNFSTFTCPNNFDEYLTYVLPKTSIIFLLTLDFNYIYVSKPSVTNKFQRSDQDKQHNKRKKANPVKKENITDIATDHKAIDASITNIFIGKNKIVTIPNHKRVSMPIGKKTENYKANPLNGNFNRREESYFGRKSLPENSQKLLPNHHPMLNLNFLKMKRKNEEDSSLGSKIIHSKKQISDSDSNDQFISVNNQNHSTFPLEPQFTNINQQKNNFPLVNADDNEDIFSSSKNCVICGWIYPTTMTDEEKNAHMNFCIEGTGEQHKENYLKSIRAIKLSNFRENSCLIDQSQTINWNHS